METTTQPAPPQAATPFVLSERFFSGAVSLSNDWISTMSFLVRRDRIIAGFDERSQRTLAEYDNVTLRNMLLSSGYAGSVLTAFGEPEPDHRFLIAAAERAHLDDRSRHLNLVRTPFTFQMTRGTTAARLFTVADGGPEHPVKLVAVDDSLYQAFGDPKLRYATDVRVIVMYDDAGPIGVLARLGISPELIAGEAHNIAFLEDSE